MFCSNSKVFINRAFVCNQDISCLNSSSSSSSSHYTKTFCTLKKKSIFKCLNSKKIIEFFQVCNHFADCEDKSDEANCGKVSFLFLLFREIEREKKNYYIFYFQIFQFVQKQNCKNKYYAYL